MKQSRTTESRKPYLLRLPKSVYDWLNQVSIATNQSINKTIITILEEKEKQNGNDNQLDE